MDVSAYLLRHRDEIETLYLLKRYSRKELSQRFGVSLCTMNIFMKDNTIYKNTQISPKKRAQIEEDKEKIVALYQNGNCTAAELARHYHISVYTMTNILHKNWIKESENIRPSEKRMVLFVLFGIGGRQVKIYFT